MGTVRAATKSTGRDAATTGVVGGAFGGPTGTASDAPRGKKRAVGIGIRRVTFDQNENGTCSIKHANCWKTGNCCDPMQECYTKTAGVRYAQCRRKGCKKTCGWECRVHRLVQIGAPEYGPGTQTPSQAAATIMEPFAVPPGAKPNGTSFRLGNVIDAWYSASLHWLMHNNYQNVHLPQTQSPFMPSGDMLSQYTVTLVGMLCGVEPSFAKYLGTQLFNITAIKPARAAKALAAANRSHGWGLYNYSVIRALMPELRYDLRHAMKRYSDAHDVSLMNQTYAGGRDHMVIHYRTGDFTTNGWCISVRDVIAAAVSLSPSVVEILDGGRKHLAQVDGFSAPIGSKTKSRIKLAQNTSNWLLQELEDGLRAALPNAIVIRQGEPVSVDDDFYRLVHAPLLVTAAGSFAITAAAASTARVVLTPSAISLNFPNQGVAPEMRLAHNWRTYTYDINGLQG